MSNQNKKLYRCKIYCLEDCRYRHVGEWLKMVMKKKKISRKEMLSRMNDHGFTGQSVEFISRITAGKDRIPLNSILSVCNALGLPKQGLRHYHAEILKASLPVEVESLIDEPIKSARDEAIYKYVSGYERILQFRKHRDVKVLEKKVDVFSDSYSEGRKFINKRYEQKIINIKKELHEPCPAINVALGDEIKLYDCALSSLLGDHFSISVFFDGDLKPVGNLVAMARLYDFFEKNKKTKLDDFSLFFTEASACGLTYGNMSALSWEKYLPVFLKETNNLDQAKIREILASRSKIVDAVEVSKQWLVSLGLEVLDGLFGDVFNGMLSYEEIEKRKKKFQYHSIKKFNDGVFYFRYSVLKDCVSDLWDCERNGPIDLVLDEDMKSTYLYGPGEYKSSFKKEYVDYKKHIGETLIPDHFHIADTYITNHLKRLMGVA